MFGTGRCGIGQHRKGYNLGLALESLGQTGAAELALLEALSFVPSDTEILYAIGFYYLNRGRLQKAESHGNQLVKDHPDRREGQILLREITRRRQAQRERVSCPDSLYQLLC